MVDPAVPVYQRKNGHYQEGHIWEGGGQVWVHERPPYPGQVPHGECPYQCSVQLLAKGAENNLWVWVQKGLGVPGTRADNKYNCDIKNNHGVWVYV